jgi:hypothetical protein
VLLVFLTKDPLNTSAVITSRQPPRVARLPQQTHPLIRPPPRASTGAHEPTSHHLARPFVPLPPSLCFTLDRPLIPLPGF